MSTPAAVKKLLDKTRAEIKLHSMLVKARTMEFEDIRTKLHNVRARLNELHAQETRLEETLGGRLAAK